MINSNTQRCSNSSARVDRRPRPPVDNRRQLRDAAHPFCDAAHHNRRREQALRIRLRRQRNGAGARNDVVPRVARALRLQHRQQLLRARRRCERALQPLPALRAVDVVFAVDRVLHKRCDAPGELRPRVGDGEHHRLVLLDGDGEVDDDADARGCVHRVEGVADLAAEIVFAVS